MHVFLRFFFSPSAGVAALEVFLVVLDGAVEAVAGANGCRGLSGSRDRIGNHRV